MQKAAQKEWALSLIPFVRDKGASSAIILPCLVDVISLFPKFKLPRKSFQLTLQFSNLNLTTEHPSYGKTSHCHTHGFVIDPYAFRRSNYMQFSAVQILHNIGTSYVHIHYINLQIKTLFHD